MYTDFSKKKASFLRTFFSISFSCLLLINSGCSKGSGGAKLYPVTGTVTFDGTPIETGRILFRSGGAGKAFSADIADGAYKLEAEAGEMTVEITASRLIPGKFDTSNPDDDPQPVGEMYIPAKYNAETELTASVKDSGENAIPFDLTSK